MKRASRKAAGYKDRKPGTWDMRLYVAGNTVKSRVALQNLRAICEEQLSDKYQIEVIDLLKHPELAARDQILAIPTLVRCQPLPVCKLIGDLSERKRVLMRLELFIEGVDHGAAR